MAIDHTVPAVHLHIGAERRTTGSGGVHEHVFPADGEVQGPVPLAGPKDVDAAVMAARAAFEVWRQWTPAQRRDALVRLAELLAAAQDELARLSVLDNGMTYGIARFMATSVTDYARYYAGWADKIEGRVTSSHAHARELAYTAPEPYGVVGIIITWNGPLTSIGMKVLPALAAGNTVVIKPSELTPYATEHFMELVHEAGIPAGVVNMLPGTAEAGEALVRHPVVQKISFTGGPSTARRILACCAESLKPAVLELGGKSACLVFPDADLDLVALISSASVLQTIAGQGCALATRLVVHDSVYDQVAETVVAMAREIKVGDPFDPSTGTGPVVTRAAQERIIGMIERAQADHSGKLLLGGGIPGGALANGFYVEPTVFGDVAPASELGQVEVFGPVLSIMRFDTEDQALDIANSTSYGLASYVWTSDVRRITRLVPRLEAGGVYVNGAMPVTGCELPFGGVGISGYGREGGQEGLFEFVRTKAVAIRMTVPLELDGAVAVLTGAGSGIGQAAALALAARGARVAVSDVDGARAERTTAQVTAAGGDAIAVSVDVANQHDLEVLRDRCLERFGRVDIVVNNVGVLAMGAPESLPIEAWQRVLDLNVLSIARSNVVFLPLLVEQGRGHVVNTASASGLLAYGFDRLPYVASKHAVVGISEALALYLGPKGIGVTCVCPSGVATNIVEQISVYGEASSTPRAPQHPIVDAAVVGELVADAVTAGRFLVVTAPEIHDELIDRATDIEAYLQRMIAEQLR